ncbi:hypothetical protein HPC38_03810 [Pasteurellaceae bacterium HPA106]|uniref:YajG family lipoprotein n=1 Tax=Spirabiliibacterium pneumoniae TaxID=221400 RepID=UPI001AAD2B8D|nr:YajG family lipoprotein [Spirabiliibacterium pneumoniae]MBE2896000.1 hypothetical protein [Spirabiliibacterium pneumoniae]
MKNWKKTIATTALLSTCVVLSACQAPVSNTLNFVPPAPSANFSTQNQQVSVNVLAQDQRASSEVASFAENGKMRHLQASPEVAQLFQQVVQQDLNSKGFRVASGMATNANVVVVIKEFYAKVSEGNLSHKIDSKVAVSVNVQGAAGNFSKSFSATNTKEGAFGVNNEKIQAVLNSAFQDVVTKIYNDNEIGQSLLRLSRRPAVQYAPAQ